MKRVALLLVFIAGWAVPGAFAQDNEHVQVGAFADYFRLSQTNTDLFGVGGRASFRAYKRLKFEAEMAYDFDRAFTEGFTDNTTGTVTIQRTDLRVLHGLFGPRINLGSHAHSTFRDCQGRIHKFPTGPRSGHFWDLHQYRLRPS